MTIDKIRHYLSPTIFDHWCTINDIDTLTKAEAKLSREIELGILNGVAYRAELKLLRMKLGLVM